MFGRVLTVGLTCKIDRTMIAAALDSPPQEPPERSALAGLIHERARNGAFSFVSHAFDMGLERGIDIHDAICVLAHGALKGKIDSGTRDGEWMCNMVLAVADPVRRRGVVTVVIRNLHLFVAKVEWGAR
jgi:hypothetical protein